VTDYTVLFNDRELEIISSALHTHYIEHSELLALWDASTSISKLRKMYLEEVGRLQDKIIYDILNTNYDNS